MNEFLTEIIEAIDNAGVHDLILGKSHGWEYAARMLRREIADYVEALRFEAQERESLQAELEQVHLSAKKP